MEKNNCIRNNGKLEKCIYILKFQLNMIMPPLHIQNKNHQLNGPLLHVKPTFTVQ